jgi:hypothetical protein
MKRTEGSYRQRYAEMFKQLRQRTEEMTGRKAEDRRSVAEKIYPHLQSTTMKGKPPITRRKEK